MIQGKANIWDKNEFACSRKKTNKYTFQPFIKKRTCLFCNIITQLLPHLPITPDIQPSYVHPCASAETYISNKMTTSIISSINS